MTGRERACVDRRRNRVFAVAGISVILLLGGCSNFKQLVGLDQPGPDEFAVESRAPLTIPPDFSLRPPAPGAKPPHEVSASAQAQKVVDTAGPGSPGDQATFALKPEEGAVGATIDASREVAPNSLASKLLSAGDSSAGGTVDSRRTTVLEGVY